METAAKTCFKCRTEKPLSEFYRLSTMADGHLNKCKECTKRDVAERYRRDREKIGEYERQRSREPARRAKAAEYQRRMRERNPEKRAARIAVSNAVRDGRLMPQPCEVCGTTVDIEAHHDDYGKPLDVRWLCFRHHREHHGQTMILG